MIECALIVHFIIVKILVNHNSWTITSKMGSHSSKIEQIETLDFNGIAKALSEIDIDEIEARYGEEEFEKIREEYKKVVEDANEKVQISEVSTAWNPQMCKIWHLLQPL